jgi:hypothetical protein
MPRTSLHKSAATAAAAPQQIPARAKQSLHEIGQCDWCAYPLGTVTYFGGSFCSAGCEAAWKRATNWHSYATLAEIATLAREIANGTRGLMRRKACKIIELAEGNGGVK